MLDEISINSIGMCDSYILLTLEEEDREVIREKMLRQFEEYDNEI